MFLSLEMLIKGITHNVENSLCSSLPSDIPCILPAQVELVDVLAEGGKREQSKAEEEEGSFMVVGC